MKNYLLLNYSITKFREYIFLFLTATILLLAQISKSFCEENIFVVDNIKVKGTININFSRDKYINKAFLNSFEILLSRILLSKDINKVNDTKLIKIKNLISNFQIIEETYQKEEYKATFRIIYNDTKIKKFLINKNISFSDPENISAVFFPALFVDGELQNFAENYFYKQWLEIQINSELINFILPLDELDDFAKVKQMRDKFEMLNVNDLVKKYNTKNYAFALMEHQNKILNIYLRTNFNNNEVSKNISYKLDDVNDETKLNFILKELKMQIADIWKGENIINLAIPLSIRIKFRNKKLKDLDNLKNIFYKISIIDNSFLEEFNVNHSIFKIYYYGNPKKLSAELLKFGYQLKNDQGHWELYRNE